MDGDNINTLPVNDNEKLHNTDEELLDVLLGDDKKEKIKDIKKVSYIFKDSLLGGILFLILSQSYFDKLIRTFCNTEMSVLLFKFIIFVVLFFILQNKFCNNSNKKIVNNNL